MDKSSFRWKHGWSRRARRYKEIQLRAYSSPYPARVAVIAAAPLIPVARIAPIPTPVVIPAGQGQITIANLAGQSRQAPHPSQRLQAFQAARMNALPISLSPTYPAFATAPNARLSTSPPAFVYFTLMTVHKAFSSPSPSPSVPRFEYPDPEEEDRWRPYYLREWNGVGRYT